MWQIKVISVLLTLALLGLVAGVVSADRLEDLEVTMEVLDDPADLDDVISRKRRPDDDVVDDGDWEYEDGYDAYDESDDEQIAEAFDVYEGDFEMEDEFVEDREFEEDAIDDEDEFEDGEDVDLDF